MRLPALLPALLAAAARAAAAPAAAQTVDGRLVERDGSPVPRTLVVLLDEAGARRGGAMTGDDGAFRIAAPGAGRYRLRAERVGYATTTTTVFALAVDERRAVRLVADSRAVALRGITAQTRSRRCAVRPGAGLQTAILWEEARKALTTAAFAAERQMYRYEVRTWRREMDHRTLQVLEEESRVQDALARHPFASPPPEQLSRDGYIQLRPDGMYYYGPDVAVLLSSEFLSDHCLRVADDPRAAGDSLVGIAFEPVRSRRSTPEIEGVLWLDRESAWLKRVEYRYVGLPPTVDAGRLGGRIEFERLDEGTWIVRRWWIRMPELEASRLPVALPRNRGLFAGYVDARLAGIREDGGMVTGTTTRDGAPLAASARPAVLEGSVWDSTRAAPLAGARVYLSGTAAAAETGPDGRFRLETPVEGSFTVALSHPDLGPLSSAVPPRVVELKAGETAAVSLAVPGWGSLTPRLCAGGTRPAAFRGVAVGRVRQADGTGAGGARVRATWTRAMIGAGGARQESRSVESRADAGGFYVLCGLPEGKPVEIAAVHGTVASRAAEVSAPRGEPLRHDLALGRGGARAGALAAAAPAPPAPAGPLADFERRRAAGRGVFLTRADLARKGAVQAIDLFRGIPGVRVVTAHDGTPRLRMGSAAVAPASRADEQVVARQDGTYDERASESQRLPGRGATQGVLEAVGAAVRDDNTGALPDECPVQFYLDGVPYQPQQEGTLGGEVQPSLIEALEIYRGAAEVPPELRRGRSDCGVVVIWTRGGSDGR